MGGTSKYQRFTGYVSIKTHKINGPTKRTKHHMHLEITGKVWLTNFL